MLSADERKFKDAKQALEGVSGLKSVFSLLELFWNKLKQLSSRLDEQNKEIEQLKKDAKKHMKLTTEQDREIVRLKNAKRTN
jgi:hypothetical protein